MVAETTEEDPKEAPIVEEAPLQTPETPAAAPTAVPAEEEHKRIVFRHPDAKSVLDQIFPFQTTTPKQEKQSAPNTESSNAGANTQPNR